MDIYYTNETLYVKMRSINVTSINVMQERVFRIIEDYDIDNIVLNVPHPYIYSELFNTFIKTFYKKHTGNLRII